MRSHVGRITLVVLRCGLGIFTIAASLYAYWLRHYAPSATPDGHYALVREFGWLSPLHSSRAHAF